MKSAISSVAKYSIIAYFLFLPLYILPLTYDVIELNKTLFILSFGLLWLVLLTIRNFVNKTLTLTTSYLFVPTIFILLAYLLSATFSISTSFTLWGFYGFLSNALPAIIMFLLLPVLLSSLANDKKSINLVWPFLNLGLLVVTAMSLVSYFQILEPKGLLVFLANANYNTAGGFVVLRLIMIIGVLISSTQLVKIKDNALGLSYYLLSLIIYLVTAVLLLNLSYLLFTIVAALLPLVIYRATLDKQKNIYLLSVLLIVSAVAVFNYVPALKSTANLEKTLPSARALSLNDSWVVANRAVGVRPVFGSGPSTFFFSFTQYKPQNLNITDFWDTEFIKPSSLYLLVLAETGILGFVSLLYFVFKIVKSFFTTIKSKEFENDANVVGVYLMIFACLIMFIFNAGNAFVMGLFFGLIGILLSYQKVYDILGVKDVSISLSGVFSRSRASSLVSDKPKQVQYLHIVFAFLSLLVVVFYSYYMGKIFLADYFFASVLNKPSTYVGVLQNYNRATSIHPRNDFYQKASITLSTDLARVLLNPEKPDELSDEQKTNRVRQVQSLLNDAFVRAAFITTGSDLGINVKNHEVKGLLFQRGIGSVDKAEIRALESYLAANRLNPNNPRIFASIGSVYYSQKAYEQAAQNFERAVILKPDYAAARFNLAKSLEQLNQFGNAALVASTVLQFVPNDTPDYRLAKEYADGLKAKAEKEKSDASAKINVPETTPSAPTNQPPLSEPSEPLPRSEENANQASPLAPGQELNTQAGEGFIEQNEEK